MGKLLPFLAKHMFVKLSAPPDLSVNGEVYTVCALLFPRKKIYKMCFRCVVPCSRTEQYQDVLRLQLTPKRKDSITQAINSIDSTKRLARTVLLFNVRACMRACKRAHVCVCVCVLHDFLPITSSTKALHIRYINPDAPSPYLSMISAAMNDNTTTIRSTTSVLRDLYVAKIKQWMKRTKG